MSMEIKEVMQRVMDLAKSQLNNYKILQRKELPPNTANYVQLYDIPLKPQVGFKND
jgi:hypothetical protein